MRFHLGFSKYIKPSKLLYWLGLTFVGLLAFLGLTQQEVFASQTFEDFKLCSYVDSNFNVSYSEYRAGTITHNNTFSYGSSRISPYKRDCDNEGDPYRQIDNLHYSVLIAVGPDTTNTPNTVFHSYKLPINYTFCSDVADTNSLDLFIPFKSKSIASLNSRLSNSYFNNYYSQITSFSDLVSVYVTPHYSNDIEPLPSYACHIDTNDNSSLYYNLTCSGVPYDSNVTYYSLDVYNNVYQTFENKDNVFYVNSTMGYSSYNIGPYIALNKYIDYQCSYVEPVQPDQPLFEEDGTGNSNIEVYDCSNENGMCVDVPNNTIPNFIHLVYPNTFTQFLQMPLYLASALVNNHDTCNPIRIDFSSLTRRFGGSNYVLTLPCLSQTLQNVFSYQVLPNVTMYNLIDMFIAFYLFYLLALRVVKLIDMIISGQDLVGFLYSGSEDITNTLDNDTGEVTQKKFKRRRY